MKQNAKLNQTVLTQLRKNYLKLSEKKLSNNEEQ